MAVDLRRAERGVATRGAAPTGDRRDAPPSTLAGSPFIFHAHATQSGPRVATRIEFFRVDPRSVLSAFHGDGPPNLDYSDWIARAKGVQTAGCDLTWRTWERYSNRKQQRMQISGFTGDVVFEGDLERFGPLLALGMSVHVGKWTSFGMGQYALR